MPNILVTPALHVPTGSIVKFTSGRTALVTAKSGTGDGTVYLHFKRGALSWQRRVPNNMKLEVLA